MYSTGSELYLTFRYDVTEHIKFDSCRYILIQLNFNSMYNTEHVLKIYGKFNNFLLNIANDH